MALYREWRPQSFSEVVGQSHITRTLQNALRLNRLGHAYIFAGPRGTGKTSIAKILAKAANCTNALPSGDACNQCDSCRRLNEGASVDVLEIDAASNRGIDEIRDLRDKVKYAPAEGRYKVYIIDEVHMLTNEAFNALLKTLEEPPAHALFLLATTDPQKIPLTVLSRCQRFDFHRLTVPQIEERLREVALGGGLEVEPQAFALVSRAAEGGLRDALSLLDQLVAFCGNTVSLEDALSVLGLTPAESLAEMSRAIAHRDGASAIRIVDRVVRQGKDVRQFVRDLMGFLRSVLLLQVVGGADRDLLDVAASDLELLQQVAEEVDSQQVPVVLAALAETENELKWSSQPRLLVELTLLKLCVGASQGAQTGLATPVQTPPSQAVVSRGQQPASTATMSATSAVGAPPDVALSNPQEMTIEHVLSRWDEVLRYAQASRPLVYRMLSQGTPFKLADGHLHIRFPKGLNSYDRGQMTRTERRTVVEEAVAAVLGVRLTLVSVLEGSEKTSQAAAMKPVEDPAVKRVADFLGGDVTEIREGR